MAALWPPVRNLPSAEAPLSCDKKWQNESEKNNILNYKDYYLIWKIPTYMEMLRDNDDTSLYMEMLRDNDDTSPYMEMWRDNDRHISL